MNARAKTSVSDADDSQAQAHVTNNLLARFAPGIFLVLWASGFGVGKAGLQYSGPLTFLTLRFGVIVLVLAPLYLVVRPRAPARRIDWLHLAVVGFLMQSLYFGLAHSGLSLGVSAGASAVIASTQPLLVALIAPWMTGERNGLFKWLGMLIGAAGAIAVIIADSSFNGASSLDYGLLLCVGSVFGMAGATLYQKRFPVSAHPLTVNLVHYVIGFVTVGPLALMTEQVTNVRWTGEFVFTLGWLVVANSIVAISLLLFMIRRSEASKVSALFFLIPPVAAIFGWALLGETLTPLACAGMVAAVIGVAMVSRTK